MFLLRDLPSPQTLRSLRRSVSELDPSAVEACLVMLRVVSDVLGAFETTLARDGLSQGRFGVLMILRRDPDKPLTPSDLADKAGVTRATMTGLLDGLAREGLLERMPPTTDRRNVFVRLTRKGRKFMEKLLPRHFRRISVLMKHLSEREKKAVVRLMLKVKASIPATLRD